MELHLIGIGTGNPDHLTRQAIAAIRDAGLILVPRKGPDKADLADLRHRIVQQCETRSPVVEFDLPERDTSLPYLERVRKWHDAIAAIWAETIASAGTVTGPVVLLVWGDPGLFDSTLRIADRLRPKPAIRVIPGITAMQALTAAHGITFNTLGGSVVVTTGRRLSDHGWPGDAQTVLIMLDGNCSFRTLKRDDLNIWWGAYLGMPEQILVAGPLPQVSDEIVARRTEARARHGWIMDTYLLRPDGSD